MSKTCIYCNKPANSKDHVPPLGFLLKPYPPNLITVPSCIECNNSYSVDEEYTRQVFSLSRDYFETNELGMKLWYQKAKRTLSKNKKLTNEIYYSFKTIDLFFGKIYLKSVPAFQPNYTRVERIVGKILKGLYYFENGRALNKAAGVIVKTNPKVTLNEGARTVIASLLKSPIKVLGNGALIYSAAFCKDSIDDSVWALRFLNSNKLFFLCFTRLYPAQ